MERKNANSHLYNAIPGGMETDQHQDQEEMEEMMQELKIGPGADITIGAGLNGSNFDATLDPHTNEFVVLFRSKWNRCGKTNRPHLRHEFGQALMSHPEPTLLLALKIYAMCTRPSGLHVNPKSFSHFVLDTVCRLHEDYPDLESCDPNTRMIAFNLVKMSGQKSLNNAVIQTYGLRQIRELLSPKLREMLKAGHLKEAAQWIIDLQLTHEFDIMELAFPLIASEKSWLAEEYLDNATDQRLPLVKFLDSLLRKDKTVIELCEHLLGSYKNLKISYNVLNYKPISKIVARLANKYGFEDDVTPNYKLTKTCGYLHHIHREYKQRSMNLASFRELVKVHAYDYNVCKDFVGYLATVHDHSEAIYWYKQFKLKPKDCPQEIKGRFMSRNGSKNVGDKAKNQANCDLYLTIDLPDECVNFVNTAAQFERMLQHLQEERHIYLDSEWLQNMRGDCQLCMLQIATRRNVYLIDCLARESLRSEHWRSLGANIFNNVNILKVGFAMDNDLRVLQRSLPLQLQLQSQHHYLDLQSLWLELKKSFPLGVELPHGNVDGTAGGGLTDLSLVCLGKKLDKSNQCSNWAKRPLRREQIAYAALDARCLLLIHNTLLARVPFISEAIKQSIDRNNFQRRGS